MTSIRKHNRPTPSNGNRGQERTTRLVHKRRYPSRVPLLPKFLKTSKIVPATASLTALTLSSTAQAGPLYDMYAATGGHLALFTSVALALGLLANPISTTYDRSLVYIRENYSEVDHEPVTYLTDKMNRQINRPAQAAALLCTMIMWTAVLHDQFELATLMSAVVLSSQAFPFALKTALQTHFIKKAKPTVSKEQRQEMADSVKEEYQSIKQNLQYILSLCRQNLPQDHKVSTDLSLFLTKLIAGYEGLTGEAIRQDVQNGRLREFKQLLADLPKDIEHLILTLTDETPESILIDGNLNMAMIKSIVSGEKDKDKRPTKQGATA